MAKRQLGATPTRASDLSKKLQAHSFNNEEGEEYEEHGFGEFSDYFRRKKVKLQNRDAHLRSLYATSETPQIFKGLIITIQGYTSPSASILHQMVIKHGGLFLDYMDGKTNVTHIIATNLPPKKRVEFSRYKVVRPEWIVESIQRGVLLDWSDYRIVGQTPGQARLGFATPKTPTLIKSSNTVDSSYKRTPIQSSSLAFNKPKNLLPTPSLTVHRETSRDEEIPPSDEYEDERLSSTQSSSDNVPPPSHQLEQPSSSPADDQQEGELEQVHLIPNIQTSKPEQPSALSFNSHVSTEPDSEPAAVEPAGNVDGVELYEAESIIGEKKHPANAKPKNKRGKTKYKIKWKGYPEDEATWEFEDTLLEDLGEEMLAEMVEEFRSINSSKTWKPSSSTVSNRQTQAPLKKQDLKRNDISTKDVLAVEVPVAQISTKEHIPKEDVSEEKRSEKETEAPSQPDYSHLLPESFSTIHTSDLDNDKDDPNQIPPSNQEAVTQFHEQRSKRHTAQEHIPPSTQVFNAIPESFSTIRLSQISEEQLTPKPKPTPEEPQSSTSLPVESTPTKKRPLPADSPGAISNKRPRLTIDERSAEPESGSIEQQLTKPSPPPTSVKHREHKSESPDQHGPVTAEQFNTELLANPRIRDATVLNPEFLKNYYEESRLHHLSTWKSSLRAELQALTLKSSQPKPKGSRDRRYVIHIDFDCFFAAIAIRDRPELKTKAVAIAHGNSANSTSSEIASCNYVARGFGVKNGMWMAQAKRLCPELTCLPYEFPKYEEASRSFYEVILGVGAERVQAVSVDEALIDVSNHCCDSGLDLDKEEKKAHIIGRDIRDRIREKTQCEVSVGIGPNVLLAKLALRKAKPAGQYMVRRADALSFLDDLKVSSFPGVGGAIISKINEALGGDTVREIRGASKNRLREVLGPKTGDKIYAFCRGLDETVVGETVAATGTAVRRSISVDVNWGVRFENQEQAETFVRDIAGEVEKRMKKEGLKGSALCLKISKRAADAPLAPEKFLGSGKCDVINRSIKLGVATSDKNVFGKEAVVLLRATGISPGELRGLGIVIGKLEQDRGDLNGQKKLNFNDVSRLRSVPHTEKPASPVLEASLPDIPLAAAPPRVTTHAQSKVTTLLDTFTKTATPNRPSSIDKRSFFKEQSSAEKHSILEKDVPRKLQTSREKPPSPRKEAHDVLMMTQFEIPSQIDPSVVEFLPTPMREAIAHRQRELEEKALKEKEARAAVEEAPPGSQFDRETWNELPQDIRDMIKAEYAEQKRVEEARNPKIPSVSPRKKQSVLPQSPRKTRLLPWDPFNANRKQGKDIFGRKKQQTKQQQKPQQKPQPKKLRPVYDAWGREISGWLFTEGGVDREWFDNVDIFAKNYAIAQAVKKRERDEEARLKVLRKEAAERNRIINAFRLPVTRPKTTLMIGEQAAWAEDQVRELITVWFHSSVEDGPSEEDALSFREFMGNVVAMERNTNKAVMLVKFLARTVGHELSWRGVCSWAADAVNEELKTLGRGPVEFD